MIGLPVRNKLKKYFTDFFSLKPKGFYFEIFIYCISIGLYGLFYNSFVSWWGMGLSNFQIKLFAITCLSIGLFLGCKFIRNVFVSIKTNKFSLAKIKFLFVVVVFWFALFFVFLLQILSIVKIPSFLFLIAAIVFAVYLDFSVKKFDDIIKDLFR
jgi:hypothetical protein